jgi:hypothetical protein
MAQDVCFAAYDPAAPHDPLAPSSNILYFTLRRAVEGSTVPATTRAEQLRTVTIQRRIAALAEPVEQMVSDGRGGTTLARGERLRPAGATLSLTDEEAAAVQEDWNAYVATAPRSIAAIVLEVSLLLGATAPPA